MRRTRMIIGIAAAVILVMGGSAYATVMSDGGSQRPDETLLEGDMLTQVVAAAVAEVGSDATVVRAETDADGNAAYEVHMVLADGTVVTVYVDESYKVVSVKEQPQKGTCNEDNAQQPWGERRSDETPLEGDILAAVVAAAAAEIGEDATVIRAETDADGNAVYEVHMVTADGKVVTVYVDETYAVVSVEEKTGGRFRERERDQEQLREQDRQREQLRDQEQDRLRDGGCDGDQNMTQSQTRDHFGDRNGTGMDGRNGGHDGGGSRDGGSRGGGDGGR